jgi:hypothetical protein
VEPVELLTAVIEASIALIGFSGLVIVLGHRSLGEWTVGDKLRLTTLLATGFIPLATTLIALILLSAGISDAVVWASSSAVWVVLLVPFAVWAFASATRMPEEPTRSWSYIGGILALTTAAAALQVANAVYITQFWPLFLALAVSLLIGITLFFRLLWFGLFR